MNEGHQWNLYEFLGNVIKVAHSKIRCIFELNT